MTALLTALVGIAQGLRHALEPDHLAAVSTLMSEGRSRRAGVMLGALWGLGHAGTLFIVGGSLAVVGSTLPERASQVFELGVALMLIGLGLRAVRQAIRDGRTGEVHVHSHAHEAHEHAASGAHVHVKGHALATRPLLIGIVHGLAGSGALTAAVLAELPDTRARLAAIACFGLGSIIGMAALSGVIGVPLLELKKRPRVAAALLLVIGATSAVLGVAWGVEAATALAKLP